jgi:hypothetical protein
VVAIRDTLKKLDGQVDSIQKQIQRYVSPSSPSLLSLYLPSSFSPFSPQLCVTPSAAGQDADLVGEGMM